MSATGLGPLDLMLLGALSDSWTKASSLLANLEVAPAYAYPVLVDLSVPWKRHLPLVEVNGNAGSQGDDPPAEARYVEVRLSEHGRLAMRAVRGEVGPVPYGLIEGDLYAGGPVPPFDPRAVVAALSGSGDGGLPTAPVGTLSGEVDALLAGEPARLQVGCRVLHEPGALVITSVGLGVSTDQVAGCIASACRVRGFGGYRDYTSEPLEVRPPSPFLHVRDESSMRVGTRLVCLLADGADPAAAERWLHGIWPVTVEVDAQLPRPQAVRLGAWDAGGGSGLAALAALLD